ncbi:30S ribosomal protein S7 [Candidatus Woesebacteria bacterium]|nr:30S ribosomal protein S7 [Candidatus Woesebacteria bacterium]
MPRKGPVKPRKVSSEPIYTNKLLTKLINRSMKDGKKSVAQSEVYEALGAIKEKGEDPTKIFSQAIENIKPSMEVRPRRVGGAAYQVPMPVRGSRKESLAIRWLIFAARGRSSSDYKTYAAKLAAELLEAAKGEGGAVKKRQEIERIAEANRAFSHFRW